jgi:hypothetical protein
MNNERAYDELPFDSARQLFDSLSPSRLTGWVHGRSLRFIGDIGLRAGN